MSTSAHSSLWKRDDELDYFEARRRRGRVMVAAVLGALGALG